MNKITVQNISKICSSKLSEKALNVNVNNRLQKELDYIAKNEVYAEVFTIASELVSYSRELGYYIGFDGDIGSSLAAFLLGITEIDPLKYNLPVEFFTGIHNDKPLSIVPMVDARFIPMAKWYVQENYPNIEIMNREDIYLNRGIIDLEYFMKFPENLCRADFQDFCLVWKAATKRNIDLFCDLPDQKNVIKLSFQADPYYTALKELSDITGIDLFDIPFDDKQTIEVLKTADVGYKRRDFKHRDIIQIVNPKTFEDFVQISGWLDSNYWHSQKDVSKMPAFRDDVFLDLLHGGIDSVTAYEIMEYVDRTGLTDKHISVLSNAGISKQYIDSLNKVHSLSSKAHCIYLTMTEYRIAWFKAHYPNEFQKVMEIIQN